MPLAPEAARLRDLPPQQWRSGIAAWLGWAFDGLEMHLYTLIAIPVIVGLLGAAGVDDPAVKEKSAYVQAAFLIGWAVGGAFFGRLGDLLGRSRALALTIMTYALCTGLCALAQTWWELMAFRFVAALGIGGEWAVGSSLLAETWPRSWRPWLSAILQSGVNLGVLVAAGAIWLFTHLPHPPPERYLFLLGVLPAVLVFWIRKRVEEPASWQQADTATRVKPKVSQLFQGTLAPVTGLTTLVCSLSLSAWWLFAFWHPQHLRRVLADAGTPATAITQQVSAAFFFMVVVSIAGNYFAGWLAARLGNPRAIGLMLWGMFASMSAAFVIPRSFGELAWFWVPLTGFFGGVFGLFTMYLPPLFPVLLRTTGAGFCYNVGRLAAALASLVFGWFAPVGDFRTALFASSGVALAAAFSARWLPRDPPAA